MAIGLTMKIILKFLAASILAAGIRAYSTSAQVKTDGKGADIDGIVHLDKTINDFGDVTIGQGALTCTFTVTNISKKPIVIYNVASSCGCTAVKWTREPVQPGGNGTISATYSNDQGPYPFDKSLTVYISDVKKPVILRLRGVVHAKKLTLEEIFPIRSGGIGLKKTDIKLGNLSQGSQRSDRTEIANLSGTPVKVEFTDISDGLTMAVSPNPIPPGKIAEMSYVVTADRSRWGKNYYYATLMSNGRKGVRLGIWAFTKEDFSDWTREQTDAGANPMLDRSTFDFGERTGGTVVKAVFTLKNLGESPLIIYKADPETDAVTVPSEFPETAPGEQIVITLTLDTSSFPKGDMSTVVILTTNSPLRPVMNLYIAGKII